MYHGPRKLQNAVLGLFPTPMLVELASVTFFQGGGGYHFADVSFLGQVSEDFDMFLNSKNSSTSQRLQKS